MIRRNSVNWEGDESMAAIRSGQGLLVGLLRCGHCGRKLHVRYWGGSGTNARYLCKGDYDDGGQYCLGFGGAFGRPPVGSGSDKGDLAFGSGSKSEGTGGIERRGCCTARHPVQQNRATG